MKTNKWIKMLMLAMIGLIAAPAMAQKNIDKLVEELEKRDDVSISLVTNRNPETRKVTNVIKSISFNDATMAKRLIEAFDKDEEYTVTAIKDSKKVGGKPKADYMFIFRTEEGRYKYALSIKTNGKTEISIIIHPNKKKKDTSQSEKDFEVGALVSDIDSTWK